MTERLRVETVEFDPELVLLFLKQALHKRLSAQEFWDEYIDGVDEQPNHLLRLVALRVGLSVTDKVCEITIRMIDEGLKAYGKTVQHAKLFSVDPNATPEEREAAISEQVAQIVIDASRPKE